MELGESNKLLQAEKEAAAVESEALRKKCRDAERAISWRECRPGVYRIEAVPI